LIGKRGGRRSKCNGKCGTEIRQDPRMPATLMKFEVVKKPDFIVSVMQNLMLL
jgi:hypothetical protein